MSKKSRYEKIKFDPALALSVIMLGVFWYSGFYRGGIAAVQDLTGTAGIVPGHTGILFIISDIAMLSGIILSFFRKYILQGFFTAGGSAVFLMTAQRIIGYIRERMENYDTAPDIADMDRQYMLYFYPIIIVTVIGSGLMLFGIVRLLRKKHSEKLMRDNAPVKSIVE